MNIRSRHDSILRSLRRGGMATVGDLAQQVGASRRTVLRDIGSLREEGYLIDTEAGRGGGVQLDLQSMQAAKPLSVPEVFALIISVTTMQAAGGLPFSALADSGLAKIEHSLPRDRVRDLRRLLGCLHVGTLSPHQDVSDVGGMDEGLLPAFERGFLDRHCLRFRYRDAKGRKTVRQVEPQAMLILPPLWYLVGWDPDRANFRHFRMDRISQPEALEGTAFRSRHVPFKDDVCPYGELAN